MSIQKLADTIAKAVTVAKDTNGKARRGVYSGGMVTVDIGTFPAVKAVPVNLYNGKQVWVQITAGNTAIIIGD